MEAEPTTPAPMPTALKVLFGLFAVLFLYSLFRHVRIAMHAGVSWRIAFSLLMSIAIAGAYYALYKKIWFARTIVLALAGIGVIAAVIIIINLVKFMGAAPDKEPIFIFLLIMTIFQLFHGIYAFWCLHNEKVISWLKAT